jgi:hypothetical protein
LERPEEWRDASPINVEDLDAATARYLDRPWLQINHLEWYILRAFLLDGVLRLSDGIRSGNAFDDPGLLRPLAYELSGGKLFRGLWWRTGLIVAGFALKWIFLPAIAALAYYYYDNIVAALWILGVFAVLVVLRIVLLPRRFMNRRESKRKHEVLADKLEKCVLLYRSADVSTVNPTRLLEKAREAEKTSGVLVRPAVFSILDRAITRDPAVFTPNP